jgi:hypothetical protein
MDYGLGVGRKKYFPTFNFSRHHFLKKSHFDKKNVKQPIIFFDSSDGLGHSSHIGPPSFLYFDGNDHQHPPLPIHIATSVFVRHFSHKQKDYPDHSSQPLPVVPPAI